MDLQPVPVLEVERVPVVETEVRQLRVQLLVLVPEGILKLAPAMVRHKLQVAQPRELLEVEEDPVAVPVLVLVRREAKELVRVQEMVVVPVADTVEVREVVSVTVMETLPSMKAKVTETVEVSLVESEEEPEEVQVRVADLPIREVRQPVVVPDRVLVQELQELMLTVQDKERVALTEAEELVAEAVTLEREDPVVEEVMEEVKVSESERSEASEEVLVVEPETVQVLVLEPVTQPVLVKEEVTRSLVAAKERVGVTPPEEVPEEETAAEEVHP